MEDSSSRHVSILFWGHDDGDEWDEGSVATESDVSWVHEIQNSKFEVLFVISQILKKVWVFFAWI